MASQSSSSGWLGASPCEPKSSAVLTRRGARHRPSHAGQRDVAIVAAEHIAAADEGLSVAVNDLANDKLALGVADGDHILAEHDDADGAAGQRDLVNNGVAIVAGGGSGSAQKGGELGAVKAADEDLRVTRFGQSLGVGDVGRRGKVDREGGFVEVALELKAGVADELRVVRIQAGHVLEQPGGAQRLQVEVDVSGGGGEQACGFGRRAAAQQHSNDGGDNQQRNREKNEVSPAHY